MHSRTLQEEEPKYIPHRKDKMQTVFLKGCRHLCNGKKHSLKMKIKSFS